MKKHLIIVLACCALLGALQACSYSSTSSSLTSTNDSTMHGKFVIYQVFTRLFGNDRTINQPNGDKAINGCGTMASFDKKALAEIKNLGITHIWYTGIIEHATQTDYSSYGIQRDHPAIVKGKAGSAYAIKDYYDVDPDLATSVPARMSEFEELVERTHIAGLRVIIDFVPNHVARQYHSDVCPETGDNAFMDLGDGDDQSKHFSPENNFYYFPGEYFHTDFDLQQGAPQPYGESPARATGNDVFSSFASHNDWYETVKLNYGIDYTNGRKKYFNPVPSTWKKMLNILKFWTAKGVDGFRCDMAEMVPAEFWGWAIPQVKEQNPDIVFIAEIYNPAEYRRYIDEGKFDYLYDKVGLYDTLRAVTCGNANASAITNCWQAVDGIQDHMLSFLENHDEQRIASEFFAKEPERARPAMIVAATISRGPVMIYFGQELGERGMDDEGFSGRDGRTTIFDYWSVETIRRWRNGGKFDGWRITPQEAALQKFYTTLLNLCLRERTLYLGDFYDLMYANPKSEQFNPRYHYAFLRRLGKEIFLIVANFDDQPASLDINIPEDVFTHYNLKGCRKLRGVNLFDGKIQQTSFSPDVPSHVEVPANNGVILQIRLR